jgi:RNA polymerase sigma-70 factor (ECF subfamily)
VKSDAELVQAVLGGQRDMFAQLIERYEPLVRAAARSILHDFHAAEDVAQITFLAGYRKLGSLRRPARFGAWVMQIARREAIRLNGKAKRHAAEPIDERKLPAAAPNPSGGSGGLDGASQGLLDAVMNLPEHENQVLMLRYFQQQSVQQIAAMLDRPVGTVTKQLSRAHDRLRNRLKEMDR